VLDADVVEIDAAVHARARSALVMMMSFGSLRNSRISGVAVTS
jgi:hypothetical protein